MILYVRQILTACSNITHTPTKNNINAKYKTWAKNIQIIFFSFKELIIVTHLSFHLYLSSVDQNITTVLVEQM